MTGTVSIWMDTPGFGFIRSDTPGRDTFVHHKWIVSDEKHKSLWAGQRVRYEQVKGEHGPEARNVVVISNGTHK